ncbi:MAG: hypothetical protein Q7T86_14585 [Hyphomicrobiaceae bacterium]|nr:hypothetical protein [Hyphomicrobiaceae bacterium]
MSDNKKDVPADAKRPHATLDLKATDVTPAKAADAKAGDKTEARAASSAASSATAANAGASGAKADVKANEVKAAAAAAPAAGSKLDDRAGVKPDERKAQSSAMPPVAPVPVARSGGGIFSHLLAGIAGGVLAFGLADWAAPQLGISTSTQDLKSETGKLQARLASLEKAAGSDAAAKLQAAEQRLAALEGRAETLGLTQAQIADETKTAIDKLSAEKLSGAVQQRLNALDDRLATIARAAEQDPAGGNNVSQIAAVTGKVFALQSVLSKEIDAVRQAMPQNVDPRLAELAEQAEAARIGTQRADTDIANVKTDAARLNQRIETLKADNDRAGAIVKVLQEETAQLTSGFAELKATLASQVKGGVGEAITPVSKKIAALEEGLQTVVKSEADRRTNAERIVVSLELANLKRLIDGGQNYAAALSEVRKASGSKFDLDALERFKDTGVPTIASLQRDFRPVANAVLDAAETPAEGGVFDKLVAGAKSVVRVRNMNPSPADKSAEAVVARMQVALSEGNLGDVLTYANELPAGASGPAQDWLGNVKARHAVDRAIGDVERQLKTSLTQASAEPPAAAEEPPAEPQTPPVLERNATPPPAEKPADAPVGPSGRSPAPGPVPQSAPATPTEKP